MIAGGSDYTIYRCGGCDSITFLIDSWDNEDVFQDENGEYDVLITTKQYPPLIENLKNVDISDCPDSVRIIVNETASCLDGNNLLAATLLSRLTLEEVCTVLGVVGTNLEQKTNNLCDRLLLDADQRRILHLIRDRGNKGAHASLPMTAKEITSAFEIFSTIFDREFGVPARTRRAVASAKRAFPQKANPV